MPGGKVKSSKSIFSALIDPTLEHIDLALFDFLVEVELVLPSILKQNFEAVCLISVSCIGENAEVSLVVHVHEV
jgi:hypothetical protein